MNKVDETAVEPAPAAAAAAIHTTTAADSTVDVVAADTIYAAFDVKPSTPSSSAPPTPPTTAANAEVPTSPVQTAPGPTETAAQHLLECPPPSAPSPPAPAAPALFADGVPNALVIVAGVVIGSLLAVVTSRRKPKQAPVTPDLPPAASAPVAPKQFSDMFGKK
jgi:hypothetical protein